VETTLKSDELHLGFPEKVKRIGRGDCQIAAIALRHNATVVTRNLRHFEQVPGVLCED
jgi:tRNA(fMet)-specific endonuclease VapC